MNILEKLQYVLTVEMAECSHFGLVAIVGSDEVDGDRELNDSDEDYFDHKFINQRCEEDFCYGHEFVPIDDGSGKYFKIEYHC